MPFFPQLFSIYNNLWQTRGTFFPHIVREIQNIQKWYIISLTLHYTNYLFYCERKQKHTNIITISLTLHYTNYSIVRQIQKHNIPFLSLFVIDIIYSIVRENKNIQILYCIVTNTRREMGVISFLW
jgi:hypothetical protein